MSSFYSSLFELLALFGFTFLFFGMYLGSTAKPSNELPEATVSIPMDEIEVYVIADEK